MTTENEVTKEMIVHEEETMMMIEKGDIEERMIESMIEMTGATIVVEMTVKNDTNGAKETGATGLSNSARRERCS